MSNVIPFPPPRAAELPPIEMPTGPVSPEAAARHCEVLNTIRMRVAEPEADPVLARDILFNIYMDCVSVLDS